LPNGNVAVGTNSGVVQIRNNIT